MSEEKLQNIIDLLKSINKKLVGVTEKTLPKQPKDTPKLDTSRVYDYMSKKGTPYTCNICGGFISWELRPERVIPLHVDKEGHIVGAGDCPNFDGGG